MSADIQVRMQEQAKTTNEPQSCTICCEKINKSNHKPVTCPFCNVTTCMSCVKRFLLDLLGDPNCMHCKVGWNNDFMRSTFPSSWISKDYRIHREKILFDIENARMPATQEYVEVTKQREHAVVVLRELEEPYQKAKAEYQRLLNMKRNQQNLITQINMFINGTGRNPFLINTTASSSTPADKEERKQFVMACPLDGCRGFLSTAYKCGVCERKICKDCHCEKIESADGQHVCDEGIKLSISTMKRDSKPCPSCGSMIFRVSGCDQMWCTQCNTAFSWNTGRIHKGAVHNPHYFNWLAQNGRDTRQIDQQGPCERLYVIGNNLISYLPPKLLKASRIIRHIYYTELDRFHVRTQNDDRNRDIRIAYMMGKTTEKEFKSLLQTREKKEAKNAQIHGILRMFINVADEIVRRCAADSYTDSNTKKKVFQNTETYLNELEEIRKYTNQCFHTVAKQYQGQQAGIISPEFNDLHWLNTSSRMYI